MQNKEKTEKNFLLCFAFQPFDWDRLVAHFDLLREKNVHHIVNLKDSIISIQYVNVTVVSQIRMSAS